MARVCVICGKKPHVGKQVSHAHNVSSRRFNPNLHKMRISVEGKEKRAYVCAKCIKAGKVTKIV